MLRHAPATLARVCGRGQALPFATGSRRTFVRYFPARLAINQQRYPRIEELTRLADRAGFTLAGCDAVHSHELRPVPEVLRAIRGKHNTTLALLSDADFRAGYARLERDLASVDTFRVDHYHTLLTFTR